MALLRSMAFLTGWLACVPVGAETLSEAYQFALENDAVLRGAYADLQAVRETREQTFAALLPQASASATGQTERQDINSDSNFSTFSSDGVDTFDNYGYALNLRQPVYRRDRLERHEQSNSTVRQAEYTYGAAEQDLIIRLVQAYTNILTAVDSLEFRIAERKAIGQQLEQGQQRFEVGLIAITPVLELQAAFDRARAEELSARNDLDNAYSAMREIIGREIAALNPVAGKIPLVRPDPADLDQWIKVALDQNLDLNAARAGHEAARKEVEVQRSGHYPNLDAVLSHSYNDTGGGSFGGRETTDTTLGLELNLSLYEGGGTSSRVRQAEFRRTQAMEAEIQQRRAVTRQTQEAYRGVLTAISRVNALQKAVVSSESALEAAKAGMEVGTRTIVDVLNEQRDLYRSQRDFSSERYTYIVNSLQLKRAAGTLSPDDISRVSTWLRKASPSQ